VDYLYDSLEGSRVRYGNGFPLGLVQSCVSSHTEPELHVLPFFTVYNLNTRLCLISLWMDAGDIMELITAKEPTFVECLSFVSMVLTGIFLVVPALGLGMSSPS
jgi:hypothetical protein